MKLQYSKILLFVLPLNILVSTSTYTHNKIKPYITPHDTSIYTPRMLSECDTQSSIYDKDADIKSVKESFDDRTSQRFEEYEERMKEKRQKRKEQRDKNIQKIIDKDKMDKSLAAKIEKGCLRCGCGLGGVAASVGLFGGLGVYGWKTAAIAAAAKAKGAEEGVQALISGLEQGFGIPDLYKTPLANFITKDNYCNVDLIANKVIDFYKSLSETKSEHQNYILLLSYKRKEEAEATRLVVKGAETFVRDAVRKANDMTVKVTESQMATLKTGELAQIKETSTYAYNAIGYSVLAILIIVLVMIIIYLVLRYRRKKKMNKKAQYTKLLNQ
ncbi:rifin [Plasmodium reichenowi]|uniref:Rifin n=1 Tax=Plasmodium reichenowi TaxID=5854 RepID=A0A060RML6_PLARE|nr:rifin [Plasmodium reichenowi]